MLELVEIGNEGSHCFTPIEVLRTVEVLRRTRNEYTPQQLNAVTTIIKEEWGVDLLAPPGVDKPCVDNDFHKPLDFLHTKLGPYTGSVYSASETFALFDAFLGRAEEECGKPAGGGDAATAGMDVDHANEGEKTEADCGQY